MIQKSSEASVAAVILAAGKGTRMKSPYPKVMHTVAGWSLLRHVLEALRPLQPSSVVSVIGPEGAEAAGGNVEREVNAVYLDAVTVVQEERLGTGHAVQVALPFLSTNPADVVLILYGDTPFIRPETLSKMVQKVQTGDDVLVLGFEPKEAAEYGRLVCQGEKGNQTLLEIVEYKDADDEQRLIGMCNSGVMAVRGEHLDLLLSKLDNNNAKSEYYLTDLVAFARGEGLQCGVTFCTEHEVLGINSQIDRASAEAIKQQELRKNAMDGGIMMVAPDTVFLSMDTVIGQGVTLHPNVVIGPRVTIADGVEIKSFSHLEGANIASGAVVGPYARLRPGSEVGEGVKIGNFVEIKNVTLEADAKVSHLTYLGDAKVGKNANIGAGTVTCNYDGYNKFTTVIESDAFVGSNTSLVAPVRVGSGAIVGAGSTVTKDVASGSIMRNDMMQRHFSDAAVEFRKKREDSS